MSRENSQLVTDQMGRRVVAPLLPQRIISLVPSQTELLFDLGLAERVVGRTRFCIHPAALVRDVTIVGGTKQFNFDRIDQLQPDLIIGNKEENYQEGIERLAAAYPVWMSDILTLGDTLAMICQLGQLVGREEVAAQLAGEIEAKFAQLPRLSRPLRVGYFIWQNPYMVVSAQTFIHDMLTHCGFENAFANIGNGRYPEVTPEQIRTARLDLIFLSSEPFPFREKHRQTFLNEFSTPVYLVDGEMFSWYGSRLLTAATYFQTLVTSL